MNPKSIMAILAEMEVNPMRGASSAEEKQEVLAVIERIERKLSEARKAEIQQRG